jgi:AraC-like DNA-binding protein
MLTEHTAVSSVCGQLGIDYLRDFSNRAVSSVPRQELGLQDAGKNKKAITSKSMKEFQRKRVVSVGKLKNIVSDLMRIGDATLPSVASRVGTSPRSLQRFLIANGISYSELLDEVRYEIARSLLASTRLDVAGIGATLGYRDPSSFSRAFMRWSGTSPSSFREEAHLTAEPNRDSINIAEMTRS